jgi:hypothetical protein
MPQPPRPHDLSDAITHVEAQLLRLNLRKTSAVIILWLEMSGHAGQWERLELNGLRDLYRYLSRCEP